MMYRVRNPALVLVLSIVTCGIYGWVVLYQISDEIRDFTGDQTISPFLELLLCIITCNIYSIYWCYKYSKIILDMELKTNVAMPSDVSLPAMLLALFQLNVVSILLMQTELNKVWIKMSSGGTQY